jgi:hypothetical protein
VACGGNAERACRFVSFWRVVPFEGVAFFGGCLNPLCRHHARTDSPTATMSWTPRSSRSTEDMSLAAHSSGSVGVPDVSGADGEVVSILPRTPPFAAPSFQLSPQSRISHTHPSRSPVGAGGLAASGSPPPAVTSVGTAAPPPAPGAATLPAPGAAPLPAANVRTKRFSDSSVARRGFTVGAMKWGLLRHLHNEGLLVYSLREREHVRMQAELRNTSFSGWAGVLGRSWRAASGSAAGGRPRGLLPWWLLDSDAKHRWLWDSLLSLFTVYTLVVLPFRLGFAVDATGAWFALVGACRRQVLGVPIVQHLGPLSPRCSCGCSAAVRLHCPPPRGPCSCPMCCARAVPLFLSVRSHRKTCLWTVASCWTLRFGC